MSAEPARANIHIASVSPEGGAQAPQPSHAIEPEARPPITQASAPGEDAPPEPDLGGPVLPQTSSDEFVQATGAGLAERLRARYEGISATEEFAVPGWELPDGQPGLIIVAKAFGDRKAFNEGVMHEVFIARSTHKLVLVDDDGSREEIPNGWGPDLARMIGVEAGKAADLVRMVISKPDPDNDSLRIPNVAGIATLAQEMVLWSRRGQREAEEDLGE